MLILRGRITVVQQTLNLFIGVQIPAPQPKYCLLYENGQSQKNFNVYTKKSLGTYLL